jgi:hypothetical protein
VQTAEHILAQPALFEQNNRCMELVLERFFAAQEHTRAT